MEPAPYRSHELVHQDLGGGLGEYAGKNVTTKHSGNLDAEVLGRPQLARFSSKPTPSVNPGEVRCGLGREGIRRLVRT